MGLLSVAQMILIDVCPEMRERRGVGWNGRGEVKEEGESERLKFGKKSLTHKTLLASEWGLLYDGYAAIAGLPEGRLPRERPLPTVYTPTRLCKQQHAACV